MFITKQRGFAKIDNSPCNHYKLLYVYCAKVLKLEKIILKHIIKHSYVYNFDV
jgi:hypothetical protein